MYAQHYCADIWSMKINEKLNSLRRHYPNQVFGYDLSLKVRHPVIIAAKVSEFGEYLF